VPQQTFVEGLWVFRSRIQSVPFACAEAIALILDGDVLEAGMVGEGFDHADGVVGFHEGVGSRGRGGHGQAYMYICL